MALGSSNMSATGFSRYLVVFPFPRIFCLSTVVQIDDGIVFGMSDAVTSEHPRYLRLYRRPKQKAQGI